jgi:hypothetical protein
VLTHTKIMLSPDELLLAQNSGWILTKRNIIDKAVQLFSGLCDNMRDIIEAEKAGLSPAAFLSEPKISKGENYRLLPYVILDYPRNFSGGNIFAIRTMFWWGNFFSITLHLAGDQKKIFHEHTDRKIMLLRKEEYYLCINEDQWQHHFEEDNYIPVSSKTNEALHEILQQQSFIKIAHRFSLLQWNEMPGLLERSFSAMIQLVKT